MARVAPIARLLVATLVLSLGVVAGGLGPRSSLAASIDCSSTPATPTAAASPESQPAATPIAFPQDGGALTVFAAASLADSFNRMAKDLEAAHPGLKIQFNFAGSQTLVSQLKEGAQADVFAAANTTQMAAAVKNGSIDGAPAIFTQNRLTIVVPKDNPAKIANPADLAKGGIKLVLAASAVPVGQYARASICKMNADPATFGSDFAAKVGANIVSEENDVKAVLAKVQTGEADAGIVYTTDITPSAARDVTQNAIPAAVNIIANYPIAAVEGGNQELANAFIAYVLGPEGQATLKSFGFEPAP
jgi:molybdate transport system substrate-binding protein